ncbi:MAG: plasmid mobilization relaxosome protein MobC [Cellulomonas sp.]
MTEKTKKEETRVFAFRLPLSVADWWDAKIARSGFDNKSEFFRHAVQENQTEVIARPVATRDAKRAVFLMAKASNNINQLAHRANAEHRAGKVSETTFAAILDQLQQLNQFMFDQVAESRK